MRNLAATIAIVVTDLALPEAWGQAGDCAPITNEGGKADYPCYWSSTGTGLRATPSASTTTSASSGAP